MVTEKSIECAFIVLIILPFIVCLNDDEDYKSYIVKFKSTLIVEARKQHIADAFQQSRFDPVRWQTLDHDRSQFAQLSDFSVLEISDADNQDERIIYQTIRRILTNVSHIADVYPNAKYRHLSAIDDYNNVTSFILRKLTVQDNFDEELVGSQKRLMRSLLGDSLIEKIQADKLWRMGFTGKGTKIAVLDTGVPENVPKYLPIAKRIDWTTDRSSEDEVGHGTFVAGVIAGRNPNCMGIAPDAELHIYRVFTNNQVSYTSWFLDAFNYAIIENIDVINLSIGGPDFMDRPFVEKILELTANGIVFVSAVGNEGSTYGTLNNPADQLDVIGVGAINYNGEIARFSARGMTTWELPDGYGRMKPDIVTYGAHVPGLSISGSCRTLSGTSVASPVVAGGISLLISAMKTRMPLNPAIIKQALMASATKLKTSANMFEQGHGAMNLLGAMRVLLNYEPQVSISPPFLDMTDCYMWPYCTQPLYYSGTPIVVNVTLTNGMGVYGTISGLPAWVTYSDEDSQRLSVGFEYSRELWPHSGWIAIFLAAKVDWGGIVNGHVDFNVSTGDLVSQMRFPIKAKLIRTPPRQKRLLWDQYHSLKYPPGYFPRDNLQVKKDAMDWQGDHLHTNFLDLYQHLRSFGYFIDVMNTPYTCINASLYASVLIVDPEETFFPDEIIKLNDDVRQYGISVILFADWFNLSVMKKLKFFDKSSKLWWEPHSGGCNILAVNELLATWQISLGTAVLNGEIEFGKRKLYYASGANLTSFPAGGIVFSKKLHDEATDLLQGISRDVTAVVLGLYDTRKIYGEKGGRIAVFGDSNCLDSAHAQADCFWLLDWILEYVHSGHFASGLSGQVLSEPLDVRPKEEIVNIDGYAAYSRVIKSVDATQGITYNELPTCRRWVWSPPVVTATSADIELFSSPSLLRINFTVGLFSTVEQLSFPLWKPEEAQKNSDLPQSYNYSLSVFALVFTVIAILLYFSGKWRLKLRRLCRKLLF